MPIININQCNSLVGNRCQTSIRFYTIEVTPAIQMKNLCLKIVCLQFLRRFYMLKRDFYVSFVTFITPQTKTTRRFLTAQTTSKIFLITHTRLKALQMKVMTTSCLNHWTILITHSTFMIVIRRSPPNRKLRFRRRLLSLRKAPKLIDDEANRSDNQYKGAYG